MLVYQNPDANETLHNTAAEKMREDATRWGFPMILTGWFLIVVDRVFFSDTLMQLKHSATYNVVKALNDLHLQVRVALPVGTRLALLR